MSDAFERPPGDAGALSAAAKQLATIASDLNGDLRSTKAAVATAVSEWRAPRADDFRQAGAGTQLQLTGAVTALSTAATALSAYAKALAQTQSDIADWKRQYDSVQSAAEAQSKRTDPDSVEQDRIFQHAAVRQGQLERQAIAARSELHTLAGKVAAAIDAETDAAVPNGHTLSPEAIRRQVDSSLGVAGLRGALANGTASADQAWQALATAQHSVPAQDVNEDGSVDWSELAAEFNDKYLGPPVTVGALGATPSAAWAFYRLVRAQRMASGYLSGAQASYAATAEELAQLFRTGAVSAEDVDLASYVTRSVLSIGYVVGPGRDLSEASHVAAAGGLPETGAIGAAGKFLAGLGLISDAVTIWDPGVDNGAEATGLRVTAGLNAAGTVAVLGGEGLAGAAAGVLGVDAAVGWVPVAGQVVVIGTGLVLAGDYVYHHWDQISSGVSTAYHATTHAVASAASATVHGLSSGAHAVGHFVSSLF